MTDREPQSGSTPKDRLSPKARQLIERSRNARGSSQPMSYEEFSRERLRPAQLNVPWESLKASNPGAELDQGPD